MSEDISDHDGAVVYCCDEIHFSSHDAQAPRFSMIAYTSSPIDSTFSRHPIVIDLDSLKLASGSMPVLFNHDSDKIVGHVEHVSRSGSKLIVDGVISGASQWSRLVVESARNGFPWQSSISVQLGKLENLDEGGEVNGHTYSKPITVARKTKLREVSFTPLGADERTSAKVIFSYDQSQEITMTDKSAVDETMSMEYGEQKDVVNEQPTGDPIAQMAEQMALLYELRAKVDAKLGHDPELCARAIRERWSDDRIELEAIKSHRSKSPAIHSRSYDFSAEALSCRLTMSLGRSPEKYYSEQAIESASRMPRTAGLHFVFREFVRWAGGYVSPDETGTDLIKTAFELNRNLKLSGFSSTSLEGILGDVANKELLRVYELLNPVSLQIAAQVDNADFKSHRRYRLLGGGLLEEVGPGGEIKHGELGEEQYVSAVSTRAKMLVLTRQQIINDDLQALADLGAQFGAMAVRSIEKSTFETLTGNAGAFFDSAPAPAKGYKQNKIALALDVNGLKEAEKLLSLQTDSFGNPLSLQGDILLVPSGLKRDAIALLERPSVIVTAGDIFAQPQLRSEDVFRGEYRVLSTPWLHTQNMPTGDDNGWYLLANPLLEPVIEIAYLRGRRVPTLENGETDFATLGVQWREFFDYGVTLRNPRAGVFSTGA